DQAAAADRGTPEADDPSGGLLTITRPFVARARARLVEDAGRIAMPGGGACPFRPEGTDSIFGPAVSSRLLPIVDRTLVLELNVARLEERLEGTTPEERFRSFVALLARDETGRALAAEYPVMV